MKQYTIPSLLSVDPLADFEFSFPTKNLEPWWDDYDTSLCATSDYGSDGELSMDLTALLSSYRSRKGSDISVLIESPTPHQIYFHSTPKSKPTAEPEPRVSTDRFLDKIICDIAHNAPKNVYKKRKSAMRRRRKRRQRKLLSSADVEPEFRSLWTHSNVGDLFATAKVGSPSNDPPPSLPTINLNDINKNMLKRIDVVKLPVQGCSPDPKFYTEIVVTDSLDYYGRPYTLESSHRRSEPFGSLPAVLTDVGPVALPDEPFFGHTWSGDNWIVKAEYPPPHPRDPGGGHARGRDDGRRPERGGQRQRGGRGERGRVALPS